MNCLLHSEVHPGCLIVLSLKVRPNTIPKVMAIETAVMLWY